LESKEVGLAIVRTDASTRAVTSRIKQIANDIEKVANDRRLPNEQKSQLLDLTKRLSVETLSLSIEQENLRTAWTATLEESRRSASPLAFEGPHASLFTYLIRFLLEHPASTAILILILVGTVILVVGLGSRTRRKVLRHLNEARRILSQSGSFDHKAIEFEEYETRLRANDLEAALEELEELGEVQKAPREFWAELLSAAESLNLKERAAKYERRS
jgi:septal ring factor EnvC (AmiA/AmiB activator)